MSDVYVKGLSELNQFLIQLPVKLEVNVMRGAMRAAAKPIYDRAKSTVAVGNPSTYGRKKYRLYRGALQDSMRISTRKKGSIVSASVYAGGKNKRKNVVVFYAHMIERTGAKPHIIKGRNGGMLYFNGRMVRQVQHPGFSPKPFMRPALDGQARQAVIEAARYIKTRLMTKEGINTSAVVIGDNEA